MIVAHLTFILSEVISEFVKIGSFEIKISGEHGYINDFSIDMTATKRRV